MQTIPESYQENKEMTMEQLQYIQKIDAIIQRDFNVSIPAIVLEHLFDDNISFDYEDLLKFYKSFGPIAHLELRGRKAIVLFQTFYASNFCIAFLSNKYNYSENLYQNFLFRWFQHDTDAGLLPEYLTQKYIENFMRKSHEIDNADLQFQSNDNHEYDNDRNSNNSNSNDIDSVFMSNSNSQFSFHSMGNDYEYLPHHYTMNLMGNNIPSPNFQRQLNYSNYSSSPQEHHQTKKQSNPKTKNKGKNSHSHQKNNTTNNSISNALLYDEKNSNKYTCKYEILYPNEKEFQIARRVIGAKGCHMKRIIEACKIEQNVENVKLRLRGKGSGYKEGPFHKESEEPLHLCISAKNQESLIRACSMINELFDLIYKDYIKFCQVKLILPINRIAKRID